MAFIKKTPPHVYLFIYFYYYLVNSLGMASNTINGTKWLSLKKKPHLMFIIFSSRADNVSFAFILFIYYYLVNNRSLTMTRNLSRIRLLPRTLPPLW